MGAAGRGAAVHVFDSTSIELLRAAPGMNMPPAGLPLIATDSVREISEPTWKDGVVTRDSDKHLRLKELIAMSSACMQPPIYIFGLESNSRAEFRGIGGKKVKSSTCAANSQDDRTGQAKGSSQGAIDKWLNEKLQMLYGPVLSEPIPEQLAQLIARHRGDQEDC